MERLAPKVRFCVEIFIKSKTSWHRTTWRNRVCGTKRTSWCSRGTRARWSSWDPRTGWLPWTGWSYGTSRATGPNWSGRYTFSHFKNNKCFEQRALFVCVLGYKRKTKKIKEKLHTLSKKPHNCMTIKVIVWAIIVISHAITATLTLLLLGPPGRPGNLGESQPPGPPGRLKCKISTY